MTTYDRICHLQEHLKKASGHGVTRLAFQPRAWWHFAAELQKRSPIRDNTAHQPENMITIHLPDGQRVEITKEPEVTDTPQLPITIPLALWTRLKTAADERERDVDDFVHDLLSDALTDRNC